MKFKEINIRAAIKDLVLEQNIEMNRVCNFFKTTEDEIFQMYQAKSLDTKVLLKWSKLFEYDFFQTI